MDSLPITNAVCSACSAELESAANQCHRCGRTIYAEAATEADAPKTAQSRQSMLDKPWSVLALLFFATAICGLPLLWKSRGFSRLSKIVLSVVITLYTMLLLWGFWGIIKWCWTRIVNSL